MVWQNNSNKQYTDYTNKDSVQTHWQLIMGTLM